MRHVKITSTGHAPVPVAFAYLDDYRTVPEWMYGLKEYRPAGEQTHGLGAEFIGSAKLGATLHSRTRVTAWEQDKVLGITAVEGFKFSVLATFTPIDEEHGRVDIDLSYEFGAGLAGKALERVCEPVFKIAIKHGQTVVQRRVEEIYAASGSA